MQAKRLLSLLLAGALSLSVALSPALMARASAAEPAAQTAPAEETNDIVTIRIAASGEMVYGSPAEITVTTNPADTQYIAVVVGTKGEAKGYVNLMFSEKIRVLLKLIPLPRMMSKTPEQAEEFNVYDYLKQLIDGNDISVLLRVADEAAAVMDVLKFYIPTLDDVSFGLRLALDLIRRVYPDEDTGTRIYLDEQPTEAGSYVAGAVALESGDLNTAGVALFSIQPKSEGVRMYWNTEAPAEMTVSQAQGFNPAAVVEVDGQVFEGGKVSYTYTKKGGLFSWLFKDESSTFPTEPGEYTQTAVLGGNYSCSNISRTIKIVE